MRKTAAGENLRQFAVSGICGADVRGGTVGMTQCVILQSEAEVNTAFLRMPCRSFICWGFHPQAPERGRPRGRSVKYSENYTIPSERKTYTNTLQFKNF